MKRVLDAVGQEAGAASRVESRRRTREREGEKREKQRGETESRSTVAAVLHLVKSD